jgi:antibiotic biosynthesis monooxygenase (ABM) superfamily enzyme
MSFFRDLLNRGSSGNSRSTAAMSPWVAEPQPRTRLPAWKIALLWLMILMLLAVWLHSVTGMLIRAHVIRIAPAQTTEES